MSEEAKLAIELTKSLIQNSNVKPYISTFQPTGDASKAYKIAYFMGDDENAEVFHFQEIVEYFYDNIKKINLL